MAEKKKKSSGLNRRQFITGAGSAVITGAVAALTALETSGQQVAKKAAGGQPAVPVSGLIVHKPEVCAGCGVCNLMCALYHHGEQGPGLSNAELDRDPFNAEYVFNVCRQCRSPSCYFACPNIDEALCIDPVTGAKYVNADECEQCGKCTEACPFEPKSIKPHPETDVAMVCDLCRGRERGPICVEYCPMKALTYIPGNERSG